MDADFFDLVTNILDWRENRQQVMRHYLATLDALKQRDPSLDAERLVDFAVQRRIPDLVDAYHLALRDRLAQEAKRDAFAQGKRDGAIKARLHREPEVLRRIGPAIDPRAAANADAEVQQAMEGLPSGQTPSPWRRWDSDVLPNYQRKE